jgi:hypothetical protein
MKRSLNYHFFLLYTDELSHEEGETFHFILWTQMFHKMGRLVIMLKWVAMRDLPRSTTFIAIGIKILVATYMPSEEKLEIKTKY